jgi:outer membrane protein OmpA-like peptidoglycan-associated protein
MLTEAELLTRLLRSGFRRKYLEVVATVVTTSVARLVFLEAVQQKADTVPTATVDSTTVVTDSTNAAGDTVAVTRETTVVTLPSGKTLQAYKGGIEDQIVTFLKSDEYKNATDEQLKDRWFNFDNLNFEFGKAVLTPESKVQLENLKMILTEFPDAKIKIGAYTDKKGDENTNLKLSGERANVVKHQSILHRSKKQKVMDLSLRKFLQKLLIKKENLTEKQQSDF